MGNKIPKIIHYCWFGKNPMPKLAEDCINSWKKYCPDYKIIRWDESNFNLNANQYVLDAYNQKKWAFVTDYVRLFVLYKYGGIYMDTDVEVIKPLDVFLKHEAFTGCENEKFCVTGVMGASSKHPWIKSLLDYYDDKRFILPDGSIDITTNTKVITDITIKEYGWIPSNNLQILKNGLTIYPFEFFCAKDYNSGVISISDNTYTIHHFNASWHTEEEKKRRFKREKYIRRYGVKLGEIINSLDYSISNNGFFGTLKKIKKKITSR